MLILLRKAMLLSGTWITHYKTENQCLLFVWFFFFFFNEMWGLCKRRRPSAVAHLHFIVSIQFVLTNFWSFKRRQRRNLGSSTQALYVSREKSHVYQA